MNIIELDAAGWKTVSDLYEALLAALGMPKDYSRNVNALLEAMIWDYAFPETIVWHEKINAINPPYTICLVNTKNLPKNILDKSVLIRRELLEARTDFRTTHGRDIDVAMEIIP